jgi:hypothetical protein
MLFLKRVLQIGMWATNFFQKMQNVPDGHERFLIPLTVDLQ